MKYLKNSFIALLTLAVTNPVWAGTGVSGAQILQQQSGARPAAMANAFAAVSGGVYALGINPAGAHALDQVEIMFMHDGGFEGVSTEQLAALLPLSGVGVIGAQILYRGQPNIDNDVPGEGVIEVKDMIYGLSFAGPIAGGVSVGVNAKVVSLTLGAVDTAVFSLDLGSQYELVENLTVGLAARNLGPDVEFNTTADPLPFTVIGGVSYLLAGEGKHEFISALDVSYLVPEENTSLHLGGEYWFRKMLALRLGYIYSGQASVKGVSFGVGFRFKAGKVNMILDYAMLPQFWEEDDFETENLISLSVKF